SLVGGGHGEVDLVLDRGLASGSRPRGGAVQHHHVDGGAIVGGGDGERRVRLRPRQQRAAGIRIASLGAARHRGLVRTIERRAVDLARLVLAAAVDDLVALAVANDVHGEHAARLDDGGGGERVARHVAVVTGGAV